MWVWSLGWEYPFEEGMATCSSILTWRIPWTEEPGGLQFMGLPRVRRLKQLSTQKGSVFPAMVLKPSSVWLLQVHRLGQAWNGSCGFQMVWDRRLKCMQQTTSPPPPLHLSESASRKWNKSSTSKFHFLSSIKILKPLCCLHFKYCLRLLLKKYLFSIPSYPSKIHSSCASTLKNSVLSYYTRHHYSQKGKEENDACLCWSEKSVKVHSSVQLLSRVQLFVTLWTAARQASLSITSSWSLLKLMSIKLVMPSNHLILYRPLLLRPAIFPSITVFQWVISSHSVAEVLEFQLQCQSS